MRPSNHPGRILAQDTEPGDTDEEVITGQPVSQNEIDDLLYGEDRPAEERIDRLREIADHLRARQAADMGDDDPGALIEEIERAVSRLERSFGEGMDPSSVDHNPEDHRETLAPDSDELEAIEEQDEASLREDLGDDFDPRADPGR